MATTKNPLDGFVLAGAPNAIRLPAMPMLYPMVQRQGLMVGLQEYDAQMIEWRMNVERTLNDNASKAHTLPASNVT